MICLGIDSGNRACGVVLYDSERRDATRILAPCASLPVDHVPALFASLHSIDFVAIERVQSTGQSGNDLLRTCEVVGRLWQSAEAEGHGVMLLYRREVCSWLHVHGAGKDAQVRRAMIEMHGGDKRAAVGLKRSPGPLYGVSGHAWQALGLSYVACSMLESGLMWASADDTGLWAERRRA